MIAVPSLKLCIDLADYWNANEHLTDYVWVHHQNDSGWVLMRRKDVIGAPIWVVAPDLGYMLRQLPNVKLGRIDKDYWNAQATYNDGTELPDYKSCDANTPEDAVAKLCIELLKQGLMK